MLYQDMSKEQLNAILAEARKKLDGYVKRGVSLDLTRGKPGKAQLDLSTGLLTQLQTAEDCISDAGLDTRNYGVLDGIPEMKKIFSDLLDIPAAQIIIGGNASLNLMYDALARLMIYGAGNGEKPYMLQGPIKFLCPCPGYDRHFAITQSLGIEMIPIRMTPEGPDMAEITKQIQDPTVKGIWCVPKFSNPDGYTYSDETVRAFASMKPAAKDFRVFWDNAYAIHEITDEEVPLLNILKEAKKKGNEDLFYVFASTSKISFPGAGISMIAASEANVAYIKSIMTAQTIGHDKLNQWRHVRFFKDADGVRRMMKQHAAILKPKFDYVVSSFEQKLKETGSMWTTPKGGYFVSLYTPVGCAKRVYELAASAGVKLTPPGSAFPYKKDPNDSHLRIAPSYPSTEDLQLAIDILCEAVIVASAEKYL